jgi:V8-like Glu-specific endopeptidase
MSTIWSENLPALEWPGEPEETSWAGPWEYERIGSVDSRARVEDTTLVPFRWICALDVTFDKPWPTDWTAGTGRGSGLLVGPRQVLTAAHNIYPRGGTRGPQSVYVAPGRNDRDEPFGRVKATAWSVVGSAFGTTMIDPRYDFAVVTLDSDVAHRTYKALGNRQLGYWGSATLGQGTKMKALDIGFLNGKHVAVTGYPGDRCRDQPYDPSSRTCAQADQGSTQWSGIGTVRTLPNSTHVFLHTADTYGGQSGSPVWMKFRNGQRWVVGVHSAPIERKVKGEYVYNRAVHLSKDALTAVRSWIPELSR